MLPAAVAVILAQASGAWASGRPPECAEAFGRAANVWERAKSPELGRYCDLVASAASKLAGTAAMAEGALSAARDADAVLPGHAAPKALEGRALAALGRLDEALSALGEASARSPRALDDPPSLLAWARVLARTGHPDRAAEAYRALLPRASALSGGERAAAAAEAGLLSLSLGPASIDAAVAALREAMRDAQDETEALAVLGLATALDRSGAADEARALLADRAPADPRGALRAVRARDVLAVAPREGAALLAIGLEATDPAGARTAWEDYLAQAPTTPWAAHARAHAAHAAKVGSARAPARSAR
jgi:tetratricopeptide (TPR) repeat protein